jgi:hypothetical protein
MSVPDSEMTVRYRVGLGNYVAFFGAWIKRTLFDKTNRRRLLIYAAGIGVVQAIGVSSIVKLMQDSYMPELIFWAMIAVVLVVTSFIYAAIFVFVLAPLLQFLWHIGRYLASPKPEQTVALSADGVTKHTLDTETTTAWRGVTVFVETRKTVLLFTGRNAAMIIPKSAFASSEDADRFTVAARHHWEDAHSIF